MFLAIELDLFTLLSEKGNMSADEIKKHYDWKSTTR